jgi:preprotein translocase subunit SecE
VARNRKRRSERRPRQPADGTTAQPGIATARAARREETPDPIEHATPDVELAEAQLALGRPELAGAAPAEDEPIDDAGFDAEDEALEIPERSSGHGREVASAPSPRGLSRLVGFLQGSWRELQRVQWPDRRQVMQATGVVVGFVIVAGVFLGVADLIAQKVVNLILK